MSFGGGSSSSKVQFFPGQENVFPAIFGSGGIFEQLLRGKPNVGLQQGINQQQQQIGQQFAQRGLTGSGLEARAMKDAAAQAANASEASYLERILGLMQPAGQQSSSMNFNVSAGKK